VGPILTCRVTASNAGGNATAVSNPVYVLESLQPINEAPPEIINDPTVGVVLTCYPGEWNTGPFSAPTFGYLWKINGVDIPGAFYQDYTALPSDAGKTLTCRVRATNEMGFTDATTAGVIIKSMPLAVVDPTITGTPAVGQVLTVSQGTWTGYPVPSLTNQWLKNGADIVGQTGATYTAVAGDSGATISCRVTGSNIVGIYPATSNGLVIGAALSSPVNTALPVVSGIPQASQTLNCTTGTWTGNPPPTYAYNWYKNGVFFSTGNVGNNSLLTLAPGSWTAGDSITCRVTATNSQGNATAISNALIFEQTPTVPINVSPPVIAPTVVYGIGQLVSVTNNGTWGGFPVPTYTYQWHRNNVPISLATASTYTTVSADIDTDLTCVVTATNSQGTDSEPSNTCDVVLEPNRLLLEDTGFLLMEDGGYFVLEA
jgi:hypothetical protein